MEEANTPKNLYLVISEAEWVNSLGKDRLELSGHHDQFIHLATEEQLPKILKKFWLENEPIIIKVDTTKLVGDLRYEKNPGGSNRYYHLYNGYIPALAILEVSK